MTPEQTFGLRVKALRKSLRLSQEELAHRCGRSVEAISNIERGLNAPSFALLLAISDSLQVEVQLLFDRNMDDDRAALIARLTSSARGLDLRELKIAVRQIEALAEGPNPE